MIKSITIFFLLIPTFFLAQTNLPKEVKIQDGRLKYGGNPTEGFYNLSEVNKLEITLTETNWFQMLDGTDGPNGTPGETLIGNLTFNDTLQLDSVLVSIKGQTSDSRNDSEKKSFKIEIDEIIDQDLLGYDNLNLNCAFQDHSSMREVLFYDISRSFAPALKGSFVDLYINGQYWGPYNNIQQIEGRYIKEWFTDNDGTRWRAVTPDGVETSGGPSGPGGNRFGAGVSTLNYNGPDSTDYNENYTLKKTQKDNPWLDLINVCEKLNNLPLEDLYEGLNEYLDIDRTLWFLAQEIVFSDDDSYIFKGGMDYYVYWDNATNRIMPLEVDGNSVMVIKNVEWNPFYNEDDDRFPLLNRLLQNNEVRQRYLAHIRTVLQNHFVEDKVNERIDIFANILDQRVQDDPKKIYTHEQFISGVQILKDFVSNRIDYLESHNEINREGVLLSEAAMQTSLGIGVSPVENEEVNISVKIDGNTNKVMLYFGVGFDGVFNRVEMFDDGLHNDKLAGDNVYGGNIPGYSAGNYVRYYIEAIKDDAYSTASYFPVGAEHDVFIYQVERMLLSSSDIVINEFMADNDNSVADNAGEYDDWIELYNKGNEAIDISGYYLSDNEDNILKWQFPDNTILEPDSYMIVWADDDEDQTTETELHSNFKLSKAGEIAVLTNKDEEIIDLIAFNDQLTDISFARIPNGTGDFQFRTVTFGSNNDSSTDLKEIKESANLVIYPNPTYDYLRINSSLEFEKIQILDLRGKVMSDYNINLEKLDIGSLISGIYFIKLNSGNDSFVRKFEKL